MNKNLMKLLWPVLFLTFLASNAMTQDFTATGPTDNVANNIVYPMKAGASIQLQVKLKSNRKDTCTVSIDKNALGYIADWITISNNELKVFPNQEVTFQFTIKPPVGTADSEYPLQLKFDAYDKYNNNHAFSYKELTVIVDNTPPDVPTVSVQSKTSKSITITFNSFDFRSSHYTSNDPNSGIGGIKSYTLTLQDPMGNITSKTSSAISMPNYYTFESLDSNTPYAIRVIATDLATNSSISPVQQAITPPAAPANLSSASLTYCGANLTWIPSPGATSYSVYRMNGNIPELYGPTSSPTISITGLNNNTTYNFKVKAHGIGGASDYSNAISFTTLAVPRPEISGSALVCTPSSSVNAINLPPDCSVIWGKSDNLTITSISGSTANISYSGNGLVWLDATYNSCGGNGPQSGRKDIWFGKPLVSIISEAYYEPLAPGVAIIDNELADPYGVQCVNQINWSYTGPLTNFVGGLHKAQFRAGRKPGIGVIYAASQNGCGSVNRSFGFEVGGSSYRTAVHPNPASTEVTVSVLESDSHAANRSEISNETIDYVKIYDLNGNLKKTLQCKGSRSATVNVSGLREGTYILEAGNSKFSEKQQILVRK